MNRWLAKIDGDMYDLEEFPYYFPVGDLYAIQEGDEIFLTGPYFDEFADPSDVYHGAQQGLEQLFSIASLLNRQINRPRVSHIFKEEDGKRKGFAFLSGKTVIRGKMRATLTAKNAEPNPPKGPTLVQQLRQRPELSTAFMLWSDPARTWPRLYRILEEVEEALGKSVSSLGLSSEGERKRFTHSANSAVTAGLDSRHASGKFQPPKKPMTFDEAVAYIAKILQASLQAKL